MVVQNSPVLRIAAGIAFFKIFGIGGLSSRSTSAIASPAVISIPAVLQLLDVGSCGDDVWSRDRMTLLGSSAKPIRGRLSDLICHGRAGRPDQFGDFAAIGAIDALAEPH
jgi:hypothetical protein